MKAILDALYASAFAVTIIDNYDKTKNSQTSWAGYSSSSSVANNCDIRKDSKWNVVKINL